MSRTAAGRGVTALDAVILIARDFEAQCRFYEGVLGLEVTARYPDAAFFRAGAQTLGIFAASHHPEGQRRLGGADHGISHLEFRIASSERPSLVHRLESAGARAYGDSFQDADGNLFHFNVS